MPSVIDRAISLATLVFLSREATQYSVAILALCWALWALASAILPRSSKYALVMVVVATYRHLRRCSGRVQFQTHLSTAHRGLLNIRRPQNFSRWAAPS